MKINDSTNTSSTQAYTDAPALYLNPIIGSLQLLAWLLVHSSAWRSHLNRIDSSLSPHFCLAELNWIHWRNRALRQLLLRGYLICPLTIGCIVSLALWSSGQLSLLTLVGFAFGTTIGLSFGVVVSAAVGIAVTVFTGILFGLIWSSSHILMIDMMFGLRFSIIFGVTSAVAVFINGNISGRRLRSSTGLQARSFIVSFVASVGLAALIALGIAITVQRWQGGQIVNYSIGLIVGGVPGVCIGLAAGWRTLSWQRGVNVGMIFFLLVLFSYGNAVSEYGQDLGGSLLLKTFSMVVVVIYVALFLWSYIIAERLTGPWAGAVAGAFGSLTVYPIIYLTTNLFALRPNLYVGSTLMLLGLTASLWLPILFYPFEWAWNTLLYLANERRSDQATNLLRWHSAFWDELQWLRLIGLDDHVVLVFERNKPEGQLAIEYLSTSRQDWAAQIAQIELDARQLQQYNSVLEIAKAHARLAAGELEGPASTFLRSFGRISTDIDSALKQVSTYNQRLVCGEVKERLDALFREMTRSDERHAKRFLPIVTHWRQLVDKHLNELIAVAEAQREIQDPYVVGVPITARQEIFVGRKNISARIEELLRHHDHPPLLLYGQRRMGKTSLLYQLKWLLPQRIVPLVVDLQGPVALASDHAGFLYNLAKGIFLSARQQNLELPQLTREALAADPFTTFDDWLDLVEAELIGQERSTILLALDEFEALDAALTEGRFREEAVLGTLRHIIQHRARFKLLLAGSHTLDEFRRWAGYLINAQVIHLSYLHEDEAVGLIKRPIEDFALSYEADASKHVLDLTRGHPYLIQLLCSEIVRRKNTQDFSQRYTATLDDVELVMPDVLNRGSQFFADIEANQIKETDLSLLRCLAQQREAGGYTWQELSTLVADPVQLKISLTQLIQRELIEEINGKFRFQVEIIRRWFAQ